MRPGVAEEGAHAVAGIDLAGIDLPEVSIGITPESVAKMHSERNRGKSSPATPAGKSEIFFVTS
jgi:hypothetical protein